MTINGVKKEFPAGIALTELLLQEGFEKEKIAVELNEQIVPKAAYDTTFLSEADKIEVVSFVGGG